jgi:hypothetical protein
MTVIKLYSGKYAAYSKSLGICVLADTRAKAMLAFTEQVLSIATR